MYIEDAEEHGRDEEDPHPEIEGADVLDRRVEGARASFNGTRLGAPETLSHSAIIPNMYVQSGPIPLLTLWVSGGLTQA